MPRIAKDGIPGSVYAKGGYLYIEVRKGYVIATRLKDTKANRRTAGNLKREFYLADLAGNKHTAVTIEKAWQRFIDESNVTERTKSDYALAYRRIVTDKSEYVTKEALIKFATAFRNKPTSERWPDRKLSPTAVNSYLRNYRTFVNWCAETYELGRVNISKQMVREPSREPQTLLPYLDKIQELDNPLVAPVMFMVCTGARPVDAFTLTWDRVTDVGVRWQNKVTKDDEYRPVSDAALSWLPERSTGSVFGISYNNRKTLSSQWRVLNAGRMKDARPTFLALISSLDWDTRVWLMRHHPQGVTEKHYLTYDFDDVREQLSTLSLPSRAK